MVAETPDAESEPYFSSRPTRRNISMPEPPPVAKKEVTRGQYSIPAARGIPSNAVSGTIEGESRKRRSTRSKAPVDDVHLVSSTKKQITVVIQGHSVTLDRQPAIELASLIFTTFGLSESD